jgi:acetyl esterase/lipase
MAAAPPQKAAERKTSSLPEPITLKLWPGQPPNFVKDAGPEKVTGPHGTVGNISTPEIAVHLPIKEKASGLALIVCPGGSYRVVGMFENGWYTVPRFVEEGTAIIVLKYRTKPPSKTVEADALADARRAVRLVRLHARQWRIDPNRIGMLGTSAGSHLILNLATHCDRGNKEAADPVERESCRPDFIAVLCPWPDKQPISAFPIDKETPPAFVASAVDDKVAPHAFAEAIVAAYRKAGAPAMLWTVSKGGHTAFSPGNAPGNQWPQHFWPWLKSIGMKK